MPGLRHRHPRQNVKAREQEWFVGVFEEAGPNVNDMMMIRNCCHQELNLDMNKWKMTLNFRMTIVCLSDSDIILTVDCKFSAALDALFAHCSCVFCLSFYFSCLPLRVSQYSLRAESNKLMFYFVAVTTLWLKKTRQLWRTITTTQFSRF